MEGKTTVKCLDAAPDGVDEGGTPSVRLDGFNGSLDHLLAQARAHTIDLARLPLGALVDQLAAALRQAPAVSLGQKADWVVMVAWLVQLRARLLLPADAPAHQQATAEADQLRGQLVTLADSQALAGWLQRRPQLGHDVFARGRPEVFGVSVDAGPAIDVIEFLWASLARFDDDSTMPDDTESVYRPARLALCTVAEARDRILRRLAHSPGGATLGQCLPEQYLPAPPAAAEIQSVLRRRSAWASTLVASLELARQGNVALGQERACDPIHLSLAKVA